MKVKRKKRIRETDPERNARILNAPIHPGNLELRVWDKGRKRGFYNCDLLRSTGTNGRKLVASLCVYDRAAAELFTLMRKLGIRVNKLKLSDEPAGVSLHPLEQKRLERRRLREEKRRRRNR